MSARLAEIIKQMRESRNISQQQLAEMIFVSRSTVANWETGRRTPDINTLRRLAESFGVDIGDILEGSVEDFESPEVIVVDDEKNVLHYCLDVIEQAIPEASIVGFNHREEAVAYAQSNTVALAFLDIKIGPQSGFDLCRELLAINPHTNVIFITAHKEYALDAWETGASGFILKPPTVEEVKAQLEKLRYPVKSLI